MKNTKLFQIIFICLLVLIQLNACKKTAEPEACTPVPFEQELDSMRNFLIKQNITFTQHSLGFLYKIKDTGQGNFITANSTVSAVYTGKLLNGTVFDATARAISFELSNVITGWQYALQLIKSKGSIIIVLPSYLSYGCNENGGIPANSPLYFDITLQ